LGSKARIEALVSTYLKAVNAKLPAVTEARALYDALLLPITEVAQKDSLIIVRDGQLHLAGCGKIEFNPQPCP
jgi:hypothetical protein